MSAYHSVEIEGFTDQDTLIRALTNMGFAPQVNEKPVALTGFRGDKRREKAEVVIPRRQIGSASNDIGFKKTASSWKMIISEYDSRKFSVGTLKQEYMLASVEKMVQKNPLKYKGFSKEKAKDGSLKIRLVHA